MAADVSVTFIAVVDLPPRDVSHRRRPGCQKSEDTLEDVSADLYAIERRVATAAA